MAGTRLANHTGLAKRVAVVATCGCLGVVATARRADAAVFEAGADIVVDFNAGDSVLKLTYTDGTQQNISAGNGVSIALGGGVLFFEEQRHQLEVVLTAGIKYSTMSPTQNASLDWVRVPLELLAFYRNDMLHFRVGGGGTLYTFNSLSGGGVLSGLDVHFSPAPGAIFEADFVLHGFFAGLRYTVQSFHSTNSDQSISANAFGVDLGFFHHFLER